MPNSVPGPVADEEIIDVDAKDGQRRAEDKGNYFAISRRPLTHPASLLLAFPWRHCVALR